MFNKISNKEIAAIKVMRSFLMKNGRMPSVRELMRELDYKSPRSVSVILQELLDKEILRKTADGNIQLIQYEIEANELNSEQTVKVPLLGTIACGSPILAEENIEAMLAVSVKLAKHPGKYFLLRASGDSMNQKGINEGDLLLIRQQSSASDGDIVVALIDDEATVKELKVNNDNVVLLPRSDNKSHTPIILSRNFMVQGVVVSTISGI
jgi:repressor LexA